MSHLKQLVSKFVTYHHGPYYHMINKGGLQSILSTQRLKASAAAQVAGGAEAVRAHRENPGHDSRPVIKFYAREAPRAGTAPWLAEWRVPEGDHLDIEVVEIYGDPAGHE